MPNHLGIPFKKSYNIPIRQAVRDYIHEHTDYHPDEFKRDIERWETLRRDGVGNVAHVDRIGSMTSYHAQLMLILNKLPSDINLEVPFAHAFAPAAIPITLRSLIFEQAAVLFNLGALYSQLAASEDRTLQEGVKRASAYYQSAAGTLAYLMSAVLPKLTFAPDDEEVPLDLAEPFLKSLEWLMLAQAQECAWQRAVMDHYKNGLIARLASKVSSFYASSLATIRSAPSNVSQGFPSDWLAHIETKHYHFLAAAQYRKSIDELELNQYGLELARLSQAETDAKRGYNIARRGGVATAVLQDIKLLLEAVQKSLARAERDNDLIYHQHVPGASALAPIQEVNMVQSAVPAGLTDPKGSNDKSGVIFGDMLGWGAREAINIYNNNKRSLLDEKIFELAQELNDEADQTLQSLNLPSSLDAMEKFIGLPPSLLKKAEEVRLEQGPTRIEASLDDVERLSRQNMSTLNEAMDMLDNEASEDEAARKESPIDRLASHEANVELVKKQQRYREILCQAAESDEVVRQKWEKWEESIIRLTWDEKDLEVSVPSSTTSSTGTSVSRQTTLHARSLRTLLENLDDIIRSRERLVTRVRQLSEVDDIGPKIRVAAANFEDWADVQPAMFEDVSDAELAKYDKFFQEISESRKQQEDIFASIKNANELFLSSRKEDTSVKERERALQDLDLAYHKYRELTRNLDEGMKFYNELAKILTQFREACKIWSNARSQEIRSLSAVSAMKSLSLKDESEQRSDARAEPEPFAAPLSTPGRKTAFALPSLTSGEWRATELPPGPSARGQTASRPSRN